MKVTPERWQEAKKVLAGALERAPEERSVYLDKACAEPALRREVESLIAAHEQADSNFMENPAVKSRPLKSGVKLGPYRISAPIGAGGMGELYRARDTKLGRDVALKVLPQAFARDADRMARFQREAKVLASLNHPNIATIYGLEDSDTTHALVMEFVKGPTLADRIRQGPIPVGEALKIAKQICEALEYAHERGIIHRDLKPANVKVTTDDTVKVLDFGLAKALEGDIATIDISTSPTISRLATLQGILLGTAAYMSPEQAKAKHVDRRADIWAFGCVLYEMLTGRRAFYGQATTETLAAVIKEEPDWSLLPAATPPHVRVLLRRCVQKDVRQRLQAIGEARIALEDVPWGTGSSGTAPQPARLWKLWLVAGLAGALTVATIVGLAVWNLKPSSSPTRQVTRTVITLPHGQRLAGLDKPALALSADGSQLAYVATTQGSATQQIYLRAMDSMEARPIPGTEGANGPFFSPDGQWLGFFADGELKKVSVNGGVAQILSDAASPNGASWGSQGSIVFAPTNGPLQYVSDAGGALQPLFHLEKGEFNNAFPEILPGGKAVLFNYAQPVGIAVQALGTGERRNLLQGQEGTTPHYAPSGHLIYSLAGNLMAAPFDLGRLEVRGGAVPVVQGVLEAEGLPGVAQYSISTTGSLVYLPASLGAIQSRLVWVSRNGAEQNLAAPAHYYEQPRLSPDGRRIAVNIVDDRGFQLWLYDLARDTLARFTVKGSTSGYPTWTPDGKRIAFWSDIEGPLNIYWQLADGSGGLERLTTGENPQFPTSWSPNGELLAFGELAPATGVNIWVLRMGDPSARSSLPSSGQPGQGRKAQLFLQTPAVETAAQFSPDGRWLAYVSDESGGFEIYVQPYPGPGGKWLISTEGGTEPVWNRNGRELFYRNGDKMMAVEISTLPGFAAGKPRQLFEGHYLLNQFALPNYDVSPDGQRFLMLKPSEQTGTAPMQINVVLNWFEELKQKVPVGTK